MTVLVIGKLKVIHINQNHGILFALALDYHILNHFLGRLVIKEAGKRILGGQAL